MNVVNITKGIDAIVDIMISDKVQLTNIVNTSQNVINLHKECAVIYEHKIGLLEALNCSYTNDIVDKDLEIENLKKRIKQLESRRK